MPAARRRRMMAERAAEGEDAEAEDAPMVESIENLEDTRGRPVREHIMAVSKGNFVNFEYRVVHQVVHNLLLTSKQKFRYSIASLN